MKNKTKLNKYILHIYNENSDTEGNIEMSKFPAMMNELLSLPRRQKLLVPSNEEMVKKYDRNGDGKITIDEWFKVSLKVLNSLESEQIRSKLIYENETIKKLKQEKTELENQICELKKQLSKSKPSERVYGV